ncbi:4822_t:CDS:10, partial [Funneliformis geosporum]
EIGILDSEGKERGARIEVCRNDAAKSECQTHKKIITKNDSLTNHAEGGKIELLERRSKGEKRLLRKVIKIITTGKKVVKNITKVTIQNCPQLKELVIPNFTDNQELIIINCPNLEVLECGNNKLSKLVGVNECLNLTELDCRDNQLNNLDISNCQQLKKLYCNGNKLTNLDLTNLGELEYLNCSDNQITQLNLNQQVNLKGLDLTGNNFTSLEFTKTLTALEKLNISQTKITTGLEYLPQSLKEIECEGKLKNELETHPKLMEEAGKEKISDYYQKLKPEGNSETKLADIKKLPLRLYNLKTKQVEEIQDGTDIRNYAILSYVWGDREGSEEISKGAKGQNYEIKLTKLGIEKSQEVRNQKKYYNDATATLISINGRIGERKETDYNLVDGRILAMAWGGLQQSYSSKQTANFTLGQVLLAVKHREQTIPVDGIYSILGLLPYGDKVVPEYKGNICKNCKKLENKQKKSVICEHDEEQKTEFPTYFKEELEQALLSVMKVVTNEVWENGSTNVEGLTNYQSKNIKLTPQGVRLVGKRYVVEKVPEYRDNIILVTTKQNELSLKGISETIEQIKVSDSLVVISEEQERDYQLAILIPSADDCPIDIVEFKLESGERLVPQELFIDMKNKREIIFGIKNITRYHKLTEKLAELDPLLEKNEYEQKKQELDSLLE